MADAVEKNKTRNVIIGNELLQKVDDELYEELQFIKFCASILRYFGFINNITMSDTHSTAVIVVIIRAVVTHAINAT